MNNLKTILIVILIGLSAYLWFTRKEEIDTKPFQDKIDSLEIEAMNRKAEINTLLVSAEDSNEKQDYYQSKADSLKLELLKPHTCPEIVTLLESQVIALENGLEKCNEAKGIYRVAISKCQELVTNREVVIITKDELSQANNKLHKKQVRKAFFKGAGVTGIIVIVAILLL